MALRWASAFQAGGGQDYSGGGWYNTVLIGGWAGDGYVTMGALGGASIYDPLDVRGSSTDQEWFSFPVRFDSNNLNQSETFFAWGTNASTSFILACKPVGSPITWQINLYHWSGSAFTLIGAGSSNAADQTWVWINVERTNSTDTVKVYLNDGVIINVSPATPAGKTTPAMTNTWWKFVVIGKGTRNLSLSVGGAIWNNTETTGDWTTADASAMQFGLHCSDTPSGTDHAVRYCWLDAIVGPAADTALNVRPASTYYIRAVVTNADVTSYDSFTGTPDATNQYYDWALQDWGTSTGIGSGTPGTLTDSSKAWATNILVNAIITCDGKTITVASNTGTVITGTGAWNPSAPAVGKQYYYTLSARYNYPTAAAQEHMSDFVSWSPGAGLQVLGVVGHFQANLAGDVTWIGNSMLRRQPSINATPESYTLTAGANAYFTSPGTFGTWVMQTKPTVAAATDVPRIMVF